MRVGAFEVGDEVPELHNPCAISILRPWIDVGNVGTLVLNKLEESLGARELGRLARPGSFFDFTRYRPHMGTEGERRVVTVPNSIVRHGRGEARDYIFLHLREPHAMGEDYVEAVVELLRHFGVTEYCRIGGFYDAVPHTRPLLVTGTLNASHVERAKGLVSSPMRAYQGPTSILTLVHDSLVEAEIQSASLMVHIPQYAQLDEDHLGASRLMEVLCALYGFPDSLADNGRGQQQYQSITQMVADNPEARRVILQLESEYDRLQSSPETEESVSLSPDVESFLQEMGERFEESGEIG